MSATFLVDLANATVGGNSILPQTISSATTTTGSAVDLQLTDGNIHAVWLTGDCGDGTATCQIKLTESDTSAGSYTDITGATITLVASATANDNIVGFLSTSQRTKRWVKVVVITASGSPSYVISVGVFGRRKIAGSGSGNQL